MLERHLLRRERAARYGSGGSATGAACSPTYTSARGCGTAVCTGTPASGTCADATAAARGSAEATANRGAGSRGAEATADHGTSSAQAYAQTAVEAVSPAAHVSMGRTP